MNKTISVKIYNAKEKAKEFKFDTQNTEPMVIQAENHVNYEFFDESIGRAPNHIVTKRDGDNLLVSFEREGQEVDLVIEGFYDESNQALTGIAEDGEYYYYIPDTGEVADYVTQLEQGDTEGQALGGEHIIAPVWVFPWWFPLVGLAAVPFLVNGGDDNPQNPPVPAEPSIDINNDPKATPENPQKPEDPSKPGVDGNKVPGKNGVPVDPINPNSPKEAVPGNEGNPDGLGDNTVPENGTVSGTIKVNVPAGSTPTLTIGGKNVPFPTDGKPIEPKGLTIPTDKGVLTVTKVNPDGTVEYTYDPNGDHQDHTGKTPLLDNIPVKVTVGSKTAEGSLDIAITDSTPTASNDFGDISAASNKPIGGKLFDNDTFGADGAGKVRTEPKKVVGKFGTVEIKEDGSYTYTLDPAKVKAAGGNLTDEEFPYTITDSDGDTSTAKLIIALKPVPSIDIPNDPSSTPNNPTVTPDDPKNPNNPTTPVDPSNPSKPKDPLDPVDPKKPTDPVDPNNPNGPTKPTEDPTKKGEQGHEGNPKGEGDNTVIEGDEVTGTFTVHLPSQGTSEVKIGGITVDVKNFNGPVEIPTDKGTLFIDSITPDGKVTYTYKAEPQTHGKDTPVVMDNIPVTITVTEPGKTPQTVTGSLDIAIVDTLPVAADDKAEITEGNKEVSGSLEPNDNFGADGKAVSNPFTPVKDKDGTNSFGKFTINADGTYTYTLNNDNPKVNALKIGETLTDTITYTITDKDGDTSTATLTVTIKGSEVPGIDIPNDPPSTPDTPNVPKDEPNKPVTPNDPTDPNKPAEPVDPSNPSKPKDPLDPVDPKKPTDPVDPNNPNGPTKPTEDPTKKGEQGHEGNPKGEGDNTVIEGDEVTGTFTVHLPSQGTSEVKIGGITVDVKNFNGPVEIPTDKGTLFIDSITPDGKVTYTYKAEPQTHGKDTPVVMDNIPVTITVTEPGKTPQTVTGSLDIAIVDTLPVAADDKNSITEDSATPSVSGNLFVNDNFGADGEGKPATKAQTIPGTYGTVVINEDGSYTYTLDPAKANALNTGDVKEETFKYTIVDKDGDTSEATLTITVNGKTDDVPTLNLKATDNQSVEGDDDTIIFAVGKDGLPLKDAVETTIKLNTADSKIDAADVVSITVKDGSGTKTVSYADLVKGIKVTMPQDGTEPTITFKTKDDSSYEKSEAIKLDMSGTKYATNTTDSVQEGTKTATATILDEPSNTPIPKDPTKPVGPDNPLVPSTPGNTDGDRPIVSISGPAEVKESVGNAVYTVKVAEPSDKPVVVTYTVTHGTTEAADFNAKDGKPVTETFTVTIPAGEDGVKGVPVNIPINNNTVYEGKETYTVKIVGVDAASGAAIGANDKVNTTIVDYTQNDTNNQDKPSIDIDPPAHVSEEGLNGGTPDTNPTGIDTTNDKTANGKIYVNNIDPAANVRVELTAPTVPITSGGRAVTWTTNANNTQWTGTTPDGEKVLDVIIGTKSTGTNQIVFEYTTTLYQPVDHKDTKSEDNLDVGFGIKVLDGSTVIAQETKVVTVVEDDSPTKGVSTHNIDVPVDVVKLVDIQTGFDISGLGTTYSSSDRVIGQNNDADKYSEIISWGNNAPNASYGMIEDAGIINKPLEGFNIPFKLGTFYHSNNPISVNGNGLERVDLKVDFIISVNGEQETVKTTFDVHHIETPNTSNETDAYGQWLDIENTVYTNNADHLLTGGVTKDDFVIFRPQESTLLIGGKRYQLTLNEPTKVAGDGVLHSSLDNFDILTAMAENYQSANDRHDTANGVAVLYNPAITTYIKKQLDGITREEVEAGKVVIINTTETKKNDFAMTATLVPLDPNPDASNDLTRATGFKTGGDVVSDTSLLDASKQKVIWSGDVVDSDNSDKTYTFVTKYGTFIGNINGSYEFKGAADIAKQVDLNAEDKLTYKYSYTDNDGDSVSDTVVINFKDYTKEIVARDYVGTNDHDYIIGTTVGGDKLDGGKGDDIIIGEAGADTLLGGAGHDLLYFDKDDVLIDGGADFDTLVLTSTPYKDANGDILLNNNIDLSGVANVKNIEAISMEGNGVQNLTIKASDILSMNSVGKTLDILGDAEDKVNLLNSEFTKVEPTPQAPVKDGYDLYVSSNGASLYIDQDVQINLIQ
ncbi:VCBS domain-containing protein [Neisseriaceae bacterium B1]